MNDTMSLDEAHVKGFELVSRHSARFAEYIRSLTAEDVNRPVPDSVWTVGETVTHVQSVYERYTQDLRRAPTAEAVAEQNSADVERIGVDPDASAASIEQQVEVLATVIEHVEPDRRFPFHAGLEITLAGGWGNLLGELLAHGDDIFRATGRSFEIPSEDLEIMWRFTSPLLRGWISPDATDADESWDLVFPFGTIRLVLEHGNFSSGGPRDGRDPRPNHRQILIEDAAAWTLVFPYRRRSSSDPEVALLKSRFLGL